MFETVTVAVRPLLPNAATALEAPLQEVKGMIDALYSRLVLSHRQQWDTFRQNHPRVFSVLYHGYRLYRLNRQLTYHRIYSRFRDFTLLPRSGYVKNLALCDTFRHVKGAVVECGTWKGGMIAGIAALFNDDRDYFLYDSYEGFPPGTEIDVDVFGQTAPQWQSSQHLPGSKKNCRVDESFARTAMALSGAKNVHIHKGWFKDTLRKYPARPIAILRADGDWYESTMDTLNNLYQYIVPGGIIIIDDYYYWEGCAKAVHDFLSKHKLNVRVYRFQESYAYIIRR